MTQTSFFGTDVPIVYEALPSVSTGLSWYNVQRQRLNKFANQFIVIPPKPIVTLNSQGQTDTEDPSVVATREAFTQLRRDLPVLDQFYEYSNNAATLKRIKEICLAWARNNIPDGKPINETNFEGLIRTMHRRYDDFSTSEKAELDAWMDKLIEVREDWDFAQAPGEGTLTYGNHYTHHYKILMQLYTARGLTTKKNNLQNEIDTFAAQNLPFGNSDIYYPEDQTVLLMDATSNYIRISGDRTYVYREGFTFTVSGTSNDGTYTVAADSTFAASKTTIVVQETISVNEGAVGGVITEPYTEPYHDMQRAATDAGESIDYIRRDALHYHIYDLMPWIEIALLASPAGRYDTVIDNMWNFFTSKLLSSTKHYEFANSSDTFDALRYEASNSEYLQPESKFKPGRAVGAVLAYFYYKNFRLGDGYTEPSVYLNLAQRLSVEHIAQFWSMHFRWALGLGENES